MCMKSEYQIDFVFDVIYPNIKPAGIAESDLRVALVGEIIRAT